MATATDSLNHLWFLDTYVTIRISEADGEDRISVLEHRAPYGDSPPLHIHHTEDEVFQVLEGEFRFQIDGQDHRVGAGETIIAPKGKPHSYRVESAAGGRWQTITVKGDFERFVQVMGRPAERHELPEPGGEPSDEAKHALADVAAQYGIEIVGPPLH